MQVAHRDLLPALTSTRVYTVEQVGVTRVDRSLPSFFELVNDWARAPVPIQASLSPVSQMSILLGSLCLTFERHTIDLHTHALPSPHSPPLPNMRYSGAVRDNLNTLNQRRHDAQGSLHESQHTAVLASGPPLYFGSALICLGPGQ